MSYKDQLKKIQEEVANRKVVSLSPKNDFNYEHFVDKDSLEEVRFTWKEARKIPHDSGYIGYWKRRSNNRKYKKGLTEEEAVAPQTLSLFTSDHSPHPPKLLHKTYSCKKDNCEICIQ